MAKKYYRKKDFTGANVYDAALERIRYLYSRFDKVVVSFSGGKDSTATLHTCLAVAKELKRLPLTVLFVDEEALPPDTVEYVERVRQMPELDFQWYCLPVKHRNACSLSQPFWYCWNPSERDKWVRDIPPWAITEHPAFKFGMDYQEWMEWMYPPEAGSIAMALGLRTEESLRRLSLVQSKKNEPFLKATKSGHNTYRTWPLYDWTGTDVWRLIHEKGYDYNRSYDVMNRTRLFESWTGQRVCQPFGEEPLRSMWLWRECWPEFWDKLLKRVPGVGTAARYGNTDLYLMGAKPDALKWEDYAWLLLEQYQNEEVRALILKSVNTIIRRHQKNTADPIPDDLHHPLTGISWRFLAMIIGKADTKGRTEMKAVEYRRRRQAQLGLTAEEARLIYGRAAD